MREKIVSILKDAKEDKNSFRTNTELNVEV
jgi:hypothetical protein